MTQTSKKCYKWIVEDRFDTFHHYFLISVYPLLLLTLTTKTR